MTLDARRIALMGFGYGALAIASHGFVALEVPIAVTPPSYYGGGKGGVSEREIYHDLRAEIAKAEAARRIHVQNQTIILAVMAAMAQGMFE